MLLLLLLLLPPPLLQPPLQYPQQPAALKQRSDDRGIIISWRYVRGHPPFWGGPAALANTSDMTDGRPPPPPPAARAR